MEVRGNGGGVALPPDFLEQVQELGQHLAGGGTLGKVDSEKLLAELVRLQQTMQDSRPEGGVPGVTERTGAPSIGSVTLNFSAEDMAAALLVLQGKTQDAQLRTAKEGLEISRVKSEQANQKALEKLQEINEKAQEAANKDKAMGILGWVGKIAGFVAAIAAVVVAAAATIATGGAAAPMLAFAVIGLVSATISLASAISQECGGPPLELSYLLNKAMSGMLESFGMSKEDAEKFGKIMAGAVGLITGAALVDPSLAGDLAAGIAMVAGADEMTTAIIATVATVAFTVAVMVATLVATGGAGAGGVAAQLGDKTIRSVTTAAKVTQAVVGIVQGATTASVGGVGIAKAYDVKAVEDARAEKKEIDALLTKLQAQMEEDREEIRKVVEQIMDGYNVVMQMFASAAESRKQLTANIGGRGAII